MRPGRKSGVRSAQHQAVRKAEQHIHEHLTEPLTTKRLTACAGLDRSYFSRLFKRSTGMTVRHYVQRARMQRAKELLRDPELRVKEVAHAAGFQSVSHFHHLFVAQEGRSPLQYQVTLRQ
jgi:AraC-like DNA-binding protein